MYRFVINAFDGEGGSATTGADAGNTSVNGQVAPDNVANNKAEAGPTDSVSFDEYRKAHKDEVTQWFNKEFGARHRDYSQLKEKSKAADGILEVLANKYGLEASNIADIAKAVEADNSLYEEKAMEAGLTVDQYRNLNRIENENKRLIAERKAAEAERNMQMQMDEWDRQSNNLKQLFPSFDLGAELSNPEFQAILGTGVSMEKAFYTVHMDEIMSGAMQSTAQAVRQATAEDMASRKTRPRENGLSSQAAAKVSKDMHSLTKKERAELAAQSLKGAIRF